MNIPQVSHGGTISGRTCATALPCVERQGILWVYPSPDATDPPVENIAGEDLIVCSQCVLASSDTGWGQSVQLGASVESRLYPTLSWGLKPMAPCLSGLSKLHQLRWTCDDNSRPVVCLLNAFHSI